jgi:DNA polymerase III delta prime subunit
MAARVGAFESFWTRYCTSRHRHDALLATGVLSAVGGIVATQVEDERYHSLASDSERAGFSHDDVKSYSCINTSIEEHQGLSVRWALRRAVGVDPTLQEREPSWWNNIFASVSSCKSYDGDGEPGRVTKEDVVRASEEMWSYLDDQVYRRLGGQVGGKHVNRPKVDISSDGKFHVYFQIPRKLSSPADIVRGLQSAVRQQGPLSHVSLSKQDTFGSEGRATKVSIQTSQYGSLVVDILQPFNSEEDCRVEFHGDGYDGNVSIMSESMRMALDTVVTHRRNPMLGEYDDEMMFGSLEDMMRMFLESGPMVMRQHAPVPVPSAGRGEDDLVQQLEAMGCQVFFPDKEQQNTLLDCDWGSLAGYEAQKKAIEENLLLPLKKPETYDDVAKRTRAHYLSNRPRAVLFTGPPGTGKTSSARVIAKQASVPLVYIPLEALASKWYGESERKLSDALKAINEFPKGAIIFLDELDSLATSRGTDMHEATRRTLGVLLRHMDGFDVSKKSVIIGATNRPEDLDAALRNRFSATIHFGLPSEECRAAILRQYAKHLRDDELQQLASITDGMSGRDLRDICEVAERQWATMIIRKRVQEDSLPTINMYVASVHARKNTNS